MTQPIYSPNGRVRIPPVYHSHEARELAILKREQAVQQAAEKARLMDPQYTATRKEIQAELESQSVGWTRRRAVKLALAEYMKRVGWALPHLGILESADALEHCRERGHVGLSSDGGRVVAWENKCEQVRLCPDESRDETARLAERYVPALITWAAGKPGRRLQYAVLTAPNFAAGELSRGKTLMFELLQSRILKAKYRAAPLEWVMSRERGHLVSKRTRQRTMEKFPGIKGALVVQEDPLSASDDWNVHLNVIFAVDGPIDWRELRQEWGWGLHITELPRETKALTSAVLELAKYAAQAIPTKSEEKRARRATDAPVMTEWPPERFGEWFDAQQRFRRTRSYGCFYGVSFEPETFAMDDIDWIGTVAWDGDAGAYRVDLIPGNKSGGSRYQKGDTACPDPWITPPTRPPDRIARGPAR